MPVACLNKGIRKDLTEEFFNLFKVIIEHPQKIIELRPYN